MIDINKQYKTRNGNPVRILCTDRKTMTFTVVGFIYMDGTEIPSSWTAKGNHWANEQINDNDLIEVSQYNDFKVDDLCVVKCHKYGIEFFRYFSKEINGLPYCFRDGKTSYTAEEHTNYWNYCRKATPEEIETKKILSRNIEDGYF